MPPRVLMPRQKVNVVEREQMEKQAAEEEKLRRQKERQRVLGTAAGHVPF